MIVEKTIREYLDNRLPVPVYCERPEEKDPEYVIVERTDLTKTDQLYCSHIVIQSNAESMYRVMELNEDVMDAMDADDIPDMNVELEGSYLLTDTATKTYRYQCAYNVYHW